MEDEKKIFIGIDLGWKEKKTTGLFIFEEGKTILSKDIFGRDLLKTIKPFLKDTKVIAVDAPLTQGRGKGRMRLYEKFLSTAVFRKEKINPLPPALIFKLSAFAGEIVKKLKKEGFILGINLIEVFPEFTRKICREDIYFKNSLAEAKTKNQRSAMLCAKIALLHWQLKTRWLGYKDGFLFLPEMSLWKKAWREKFHQTWKNRHRLKYRYLFTNLFV